MTTLLFILGLGLLFGGAELLVRGASRLAGYAGISPLVIGLTVVAFGTSAPELAVAIGAAGSGQPDVAVGNVVGSNIFNVLFILGLSALVTPLAVAQQLIRIDVPLMIGVSLLTWALALDGAISVLDGAVLVGLLVGYLFLALHLGRRERSPEVLAEYAAAQHAAPVSAPSSTSPPAAPGAATATNGRWRIILLQVLFILAGLVMLALGARWLVAGAVAFARWAGMSELVIGLTIVAAGTSLPEVAASVAASIRGQRDIAVGNVVGSNLFNLMGILGISSIIAGGEMRISPAVEGFDLPVMIAVALACMPIFFTGQAISRWEGAIFLLYYAAYTGYLLLDAGGHDALPLYNFVMLAFVAPVTVLTLSLSAFRSLRARRSRTTSATAGASLPGRS